MAKGRFRIGVDIGGTFTDVVLLEDDGTVHIAKAVSTPHAYEHGILKMLARLLRENAIPAEGCTEVSHGTTIATNAIVEHKGAATGLITTKGFRDVLELRRIRIPRQYDLTWEKPQPLVERYLRLEVEERSNYKGEVLAPLDAESVRRALRRLLEHGMESVAVCLLHSFANPAHERSIRDILRREAPGLHVSLSSDVLPEMREYERTSTTVINAYVQPVVKRYLASLESGLRAQDFRAPVLMMQSNGGVMAAELAGERPIHIIESGPAAGVIAAHQLGRRISEHNIISMDIGGTTAKASLIEGGRLSFSSEYEVGGGFSQSSRLARGGGYTLRVPTLDISEIGAGGGSVVWVDRGGALQVGPQSAGANPGPACYMLGGQQPTLTDACLLLGYLDPAGIAGGSLPLSVDRARQALRERVAAPLGMDLTELAYGVVRIAVSNMTRVIRSVSTERGKDPRDFVLFAFGGNGGLFAAAVAHELELPRVVVPPASGIFSAFGLLYSDAEHHLTQTLLERTDELDPATVEEAWKHLEEQAVQTLGREGYPSGRCRLRRIGELRYFGQTHELAVPWPNEETRRETLSRLAVSFEEEHHRTYGHRGHDSIVELVTLHLVATGEPDAPRFPEKLRFPADAPSPTGRREAYFGPAAGWRPARLLGRSALGSTPTPGPIITQEVDATLLVPPDSMAYRDGWNNVVITLKP